MNILVLQETDWLHRGPNTQHHIFDRLSRNPAHNIFVLDYDIDKKMKGKSLFIKKQTFKNIDRAIQKSNVKIIRTSHLQVPYLRRISSLVSNFFEIIRIIKKYRIDIIFGYSMTNGLIGLFISKLLHVPFIFYCIDLLHTLVPIKIAQPFAEYVNYILLKFSDQIIVVTQMLKDYVLSKNIIPEKVKLLLNGISLDNTIVNEPKLEIIKEKYSLRENDFILLFMGYLYDFAGLIEIIDYYNNDVKANKIKLKFLILGDGGIYNKLLKHITNIEANWVIPLGRVPFFEITEYIAVSDLCLLSFDLNDITRKITPVKVMEYMAMKKPVLSNKLPSVFNEIGINNGVIFTENQNDLIQKIGDLLSQKEKLKKIGSKGFKLIEEKYLWSKILRDLKDIIIKLIRDKRK